MSPFRTPAEMPVEIVIPVPFSAKARFLLAAAIVAPVRLVQWCWPWFAVNGAASLCLFFLWLDHPRMMGVLLGTMNILAGLVWGGLRAYRWAERELATDSPSPGAGGKVEP
jgi:hypothetical protein